MTFEKGKPGNIPNESSKRIANSLRGLSVGAYTLFDVTDYVQLKNTLHKSRNFGNKFASDLWGRVFSLKIVTFANMIVVSRGK